MKRQLLSFVVGSLVIGAIAGFTVARLTSTSGGDVDTSSGGENKVLYWVAPMDPGFRSDQPGKSPMGMDLIPVYESDQPGMNATEGAVQIAPAVINNLGVRTAKVERQDLGRKIDAVGYIGYDETKVTHIDLRADGWIEDLRIKSEGERVKKGDLLFRIYSPTLVNAQSELVQAVNRGRDNLVEASRARLRALGISDGQIAQISEKGQAEQLVSFFAPQNGVVAELNVAEGMYVRPGTSLATLADLSTVWMLADVFEGQSPWIKTGLPAEASLTFLPGIARPGRVEYVYPTLEPDTRALRVRLKFDNPDEALKPNMFANVAIEAEPIVGALTVPRDAVIRSGKFDRVILALGEGKFQVVEVVIGIEAQDLVEVKRGLREDEEVVVSGQFLIDSEASLSGSIRRLSSDMSDPGKRTERSE